MLPWLGWIPGRGTEIPASFAEKPKKKKRFTFEWTLSITSVRKLPKALNLGPDLLHNKRLTSVDSGVKDPASPRGDSLLMESKSEQI